MRRVLVVPLTWSIVMLAGCAGNPTPQENASPPAAPSKPIGSSTAAPTQPTVTTTPKLETGEAIVTKILVSAKHAQADANTSQQTTVAPTFPIHASASLMGQGRVKLTAIWQYQTGAVMGRTNTWVTLDGAASVSFRVDQADPWPLGWYQLEIDVNDQKPNSAEHFMVTSQGIISEGIGPRSRFPRKAHNATH